MTDLATARGTVAGARRARVTAALAPAAVYLGVRLVGIAVLAAMAARNGSGLLDELVSWDGQWLLGIAGFGYDGVPAALVDARGDRAPDTALGFFPGYPALVAVVAPVTGGVIAAGLLVALVAGLVAAYGMARLGEIVPGGSRRAGLVLVALFAATPMSVVLTMAYSEGLFCALAVWALVALLRRQWVLAGALTALAGLVRPTATALVAAVGLAAVVAILARRDGAGPWFAALLAPAGWLGYLGYVAARTGELTGWFRVQREGWGWYLDPDATARYVVTILAAGERTYEITTAIVLLGALVLLALAVRERLPWPLLVYAVGVLVTVWGTEGLMNTKIRLLLPAFVLLVPVALGLARRRPATAVTVLVGVTLASAWFGAHALTVWRYGI
ncbi:MAG: hypothetical protein ACT4RN_13445 [Pseudonocardia sp.]